LLKDYFTAGFIFASAALRADLYFLNSSGKFVTSWIARRKLLWRWVWDFTSWPFGILKIILFGTITIVGLALMKRIRLKNADKNHSPNLDHITTELLSAATVINGSMRVFFESFIWFAIIISAQYAFIFSGAKSQPPISELLWI